MRIWLAVVLLSGMGWTAATGALQQRAPMAQRELLSVEGGLTRYDKEQRLLWIRTGDGGEMEFSYTASTPLVGATRQLEIGDRLKVFYEVDGSVNRAMRVEVVPEAPKEN